MSKITCTAFMLVICFCTAHAQKTLNPDSLTLYQRLDASYVFGGQIYNNNFIYNPGFSFSASMGLKLNESVAVGAGAGYYKLENENFIPLFVEATGCRKNKENSPMITMQVGYAPAWSAGHLQQNYKFRGGIYIDAGMGRRYNVNKNLALYFHWSYRHQFARMEYQIFGDQQYSEALNYDMLVISLGIIRRCP